MKLDDLNLRVASLINDALEIVQDCDTPEELEVLASSVAFILATLSDTTDDQKKQIFEAGQDARRRIEEREKNGI